jgi:hypothetical protein
LNRYLKLVHMEVRRFRYILAGLLAILFICQFGSMIWTLLNEISLRNEATLRNEVINNGSAYFPGDKLSFAWTIFNTQFWFIVPVLISIAVLVLYVFVIWYRDWFGRDTFIYRLLTLPTARRHIYLAKLTAILLFVFGLLSYQLVLLVLENLAFTLIVPADMREASYFSDAVSANQAFAVLLPQRSADFLVSYGLGIAALILLFTAILLERSFRRVGIIIAVFYLMVCVGIILFLRIYFGSIDTYFFPNEHIAIWFGMIGVIMAVSLRLGFWLMDKKITV